MSIRDVDALIEQHHAHRAELRAFRTRVRRGYEAIVAETIADLEGERNPYVRDDLRREITDCESELQIMAAEDVESDRTAAESLARLEQYRADVLRRQSMQAA